MAEELNSETIYLDRTINELIANSVYTNSSGAPTTTTPVEYSFTSTQALKYAKVGDSITVQTVVFSSTGALTVPVASTITAISDDMLTVSFVLTFSVAVPNAETVTISFITPSPQYTNELLAEQTAVRAFDVFTTATYSNAAQIKKPKTTETVSNPVQLNLQTAQLTVTDINTGYSILVIEVGPTMPDIAAFVLPDLGLTSGGRVVSLGAHGDNQIVALVTVSTADTTDANQLYTYNTVVDPLNDGIDTSSNLPTTVKDMFTVPTSSAVHTSTKSGGYREATVIAFTAN